MDVVTGGEDDAVTATGCFDDGTVEDDETVVVGADGFLFEMLLELLLLFGTLIVEFVAAFFWFCCCFCNFSN